MSTQSRWPNGLGISQLGRSTIIVFLGLTLFSAVTHAQPVKEVFVTNDATSPRTPFAIQLDGQIGVPTSGNCGVTFNVPDQLLVIEGFSVETGVVITKTTVNVSTTGVTVNHFYPRQSAGTIAATWHNVRLYADPGSTVNFLMRVGGAAGIPCTLAVSGYLIDPSSPSLAP